MTPIRIPEEVRAAVYAHARAAFPDECCGYLCGPRDGDAVDTAIACRNAQLDGDHPIAAAAGRGADTGFVIGGAELLAFARRFDGPAPPRIVYHSHPNGEAYFSAVDRNSATLRVAAPRDPASSTLRVDEAARAPAEAAGPVYPVQHLVVGVTAAGVVEAAQFAWSDAAGDHVEVARWSVP